LIGRIVFAVQVVRRTVWRRRVMSGTRLPPGRVDDGHCSEDGEERQRKPQPGDGGVEIATLDLHDPQVLTCGLEISRGVRALGIRQVELRVIEDVVEAGLRPRESARRGAEESAE
jgi:hypothetical protein